MPKRHRGPYPPEFRRRIVELVRAGRTPESLAKEFEPTGTAIRNWVRQADLDAGTRTDGMTTDEREELVRLRRENRTLQEERNPKKIRGLVRAGIESDAAEAFRFVRAYQAVHCVRTMCRLLSVSTSGFYASVDRPLSTRAKRDVVLSAKLEVAHEESRGTYGAPRLHAELAAGGEHVGKKRVVRLMRAAGLVGISPRKAMFTTVRDPAGRPSDDLVKRDFTATTRDQLWVADITYVPTWAGFLYLAVVLDAWSRRIVGWAMSTSLKTDVVLDALDMAVTQRQPRNVVHHSDHGCQYTSIAFGLRCKEAGVRPSMGTVGDAYDNAMCESFFGTLECELLDRRRFRSQAEARMAVFDYLEGFYNPRRRHSALGYTSPIEYERTQKVAA